MCHRDWVWDTGGGGTTSGPDATPPPLSVKTWGGGGAGGAVWGGRLEGVGGSPHPQLEGPRQSVGVRIPNSRGHAKAWESVSPTQGATPKGGKERQEEERKNAVTALTPKEFRAALGPGPLLRMQDLHFTTNDICIAARLANLPLESTLQQTKFV